MTTYEHVMLGVNGTIAIGSHERHGWKIVAMAGIAAASPDWDGLTWLVSNEAFSVGHRVWGHNILACAVAGILVGLFDYRFDICARLGHWITRLLRLDVAEVDLAIRKSRTGEEQRMWVLTGALAALSQLPADLAVSGTKTLPVWGLKLFWPFSDRDWSYQLVTYNDPGAIILLIVGMFWMALRPATIKRTARVTLSLVIAYLLFRGFVCR